MTASIFVLDANVFIDAHRRYYGLDLCPGFWECLLHYGERQRLASIDRVRQELVGSGDALSKWIRDAPGALFRSSAEPAVLNTFEETMTWVDESVQFRPQAKEEFATAADGWLAAYAKVHSAVVVTHERRRPDAKRRVPLGNVCDRLGVPMQDTFEMLRQLEVCFQWTGSLR